MTRQTASESKTSAEPNELLAWLQKENPPLIAEDAFVVPLWFSQQSTWLEDRFNSDNAVYNYPLLLRIRGPLNEVILQQSLQEIVRRQETLRSVFRMRNGKLVQIVLPPAKLTLSVIDLSGLPESEAEAAAQRLALEEALQPFDLTKAPLLRTVLMRLGSDNHILQLTSHHLVHDDWSTTILFRELSELYQAFAAGTASPLADLVFQYGDYVRWHEDQFRGKAAKLAYWKQQLASTTTFQHLATDFPRPQRCSNRGAHENLILPADLLDQLKTLSRDERISVFMVLLAGFQCLLHRYSNAEEIGIASCAANRPLMEVEGLMGRFGNDMLLRTSLSGDLTFCELLGRVRETCLNAYQDQDLPFGELLKDVANRADPNRELPFQVMFILQNAPKEIRQVPELTMSCVPLDTGTAKYDLNVWLKIGSMLEVALEYRTDLFQAATMKQILDDYETILRTMAKDPGARIHNLAISRKAEPAQNSGVAAIAKEILQPNDRIAPKNDVESGLIDLWEGALGIRPIGLDQDFFELGGDSLLAARLFPEIEKIFRVELPLVSLLEAPTIRQLAEIISGRKTRSSPRKGNMKSIAEEDIKLLKREGFFVGGKNRLLQFLARNSPGATSLRVWLNRWRGARIGRNVWIGYDTIIETACPHLVTIRDGAVISMRVTIIAHFRKEEGRVVIEEDAFVGPGAIILPDTVIGQDAVVTAGSVVTQSVPPRTVVQGNPARSIATIGVPLVKAVSVKQFSKGLRPLR